MKKYIVTSATALMLSTSSLYALNAQQVWMITQPALVDAGFDMENAQITQTPSGIEITNLDLNKSSPEEFFKIPALNINNVGDGVEITIPQKISGKAPNGEEIMIDLSQVTLFAEDVQGFTMIGPFSGKIEGPLSFAFKNTDSSTNTVSTMNVNMADFMVDIPAPTADGSSVARIETGFTKATYNGEMDPGTTGQFISEYGPSTTEITVTDIATFWTSMDPIAAISQGANVMIDIEQDAGQYALQTTGQEAMSMAATWEAAKGFLKLDRDGISYDYDTNAMSMSVTGDGGDMPNLNFKMDKATGQMIIPLFAKSQEQSANITTRLDNLTFEAAGTQVPQEAKPFFGKVYNIDISMSAGLKLIEDLWPKNMNDDIEARAPNAGQLTSAKLDKFYISMGETELDAQGQMNFTGTNFEDTMPSNGEVTVSLTQAFSLLQELVSNGTIAPEEAGMAEMMLRGMAKPGEVDPLTYTIKVDNERLTINGNPM